MNYREEKMKIVYGTIYAAPPIPKNYFQFQSPILPFLVTANVRHPFLEQDQSIL